MSGAHAEEVVKSAVPIPDLGLLDAALRGDAAALKAAVQKHRPADLGRDFSRRSVAECRRLIEAADDRRAAAMLRSAHPAVAANVLGSCSPEHASRLLAFMPTDHRVAILGAVDADNRSAIEAALPPEQKADATRILAYGESAVARLMTPKIWRVDRARTAGEAMAELRERADQIEVAQNCYVVDGDKLVGVAPLRELALAAPEARLEDLMTRDPIAVSEETERGDAAEIIQTHDFLSLPVITKEGKLVGAVRVDDLLDAALSKVGTGFLNQGGVSGSVAAQVPYFQTSLFKVVRSRITWLVLLFVAETATGTVLRTFEDELAKVVALSFFIPLLIGTGGNAGSQTVSTVIRALALGEVRMKDVLRVLVKEVTTGIVLGVLLGAIAFGRARLWGVGNDLAGCVGITVLVVCTWANTVGAVIPIAAQRVGVDPTVISGPLITTLVDASGLFLYLSIAKLMIAKLHGG
ncbi:MAG: magnesium transporter [Byssovorax sp.]